jgi:hypothetical protein
MAGRLDTRAESQGGMSDAPLRNRILQNYEFGVDLLSVDIADWSTQH